MSRRRTRSAWRSAAAIAALTLGAFGCTMLLSLDNELTIASDASAPASDAPVRVVVVTQTADGNVPAMPPDYCKAKGWHFDCDFGTYGVVRLEDTPAASPPILTRYGTTSLKVVGTRTHGNVPFLYSIDNGQATPVSSPMLVGAPVDLVYREKFGLMALLTDVIDDAGVHSPEVFVLGTDGLLIGHGGGTGSDVSGLTAQRLVAVDTDPANALGYSVLILTNRGSSVADSTPVLIRTNYPDAGSTTTDVVTGAGPSVATAAVEIKRGDSGIFG